MDNGFKIMAPLASSRDVKALKEAGADKLYCGYIDREGAGIAPRAFLLLNRRGERGSFTNYSRFKEAVSEACVNNLPVYVTMNGLYTPEYYPWLENTIERLEGLHGVTGLIVADIGLILYLKKLGYEKELVVSTGGTAFNHRAIDFFASLGASSVQLPRHLTFREIEEIVEMIKTDTAINIFIFRSACTFIDGFCSFLHCMEESMVSKIDDNTIIKKSFVPGGHALACSMIKASLARADYEVVSKGSPLNLKYDHGMNPFGCNFCGLFRLRQYNGITLKIVGRGESGSNMVKTVRTIKGLLDALDSEGITEDKFKDLARKEYFKMTGSECTGYKCYCPSILIDE